DGTGLDFYLEELDVKMESLVCYLNALTDLESNGLSSQPIVEPTCLVAPINWGIGQKILLLQQ
ncbi:Uncharacterized protein DAT39_005937, partial [Clarias magur]